MIETVLSVAPFLLGFILSVALLVASLSAKVNRWADFKILLPLLCWATKGQPRWAYREWLESTRKEPWWSKATPAEREAAEAEAWRYCLSRRR